MTRITYDAPVQHIYNCSRRRPSLKLASEKLADASSRANTKHVHVLFIAGDASSQRDCTAIAPMANRGGVGEVDVVKEQRVLAHEHVLGVGEPSGGVLHVQARDLLVARHLDIRHELRAGLDERVPTARCVLP
jgi:hypothetical protein